MELVALVEGKVKDDSDKLTLVADYYPAVAAALASYSKHRPKIKVTDLPGTDSHDLALPAEWVADFSTIREVEYPLGNIPPSQLATDAWILYRSPGGLQLRMLETDIGSGESVRVSFTVMRLEADVPAGDLDALACLGAAICCEVLANLYIQSTDSTIGADVVNRGSKGGDYGRRAKALRQRYLDHIGVDEGSTQPAMSTVAAKPKSGRTRLTH